MLPKIPDIYISNDFFVLNKYIQQSGIGKKFSVPDRYKFFLKHEQNDPAAASEQEEKIHSHKKRNLAIFVGTTALFAGLSVLFISRGLPKNTSKHLEKLKTFFERKLDKSKFNGKDFMTGFYRYSIRKLNNFIDKTQSINNVTSLKDILFKKFMYKTKFTSKIHKSVTKFFEKLSRKTVVSSYKKTDKNFNRMYESFDRLDDAILAKNPDEIILYNGNSYTKKELVALAKSKREGIKDTVSKFTSQSAMIARYKYIKTAMSKLYNKFWEASFKGFWSKNNQFLKKDLRQTFVPAELLSEDKKAFIDEVTKLRNSISYTNKDKENNILSHIKELENLIAYKDKDSFKTIKKLEWFINNSDELNQNEKVFMKTLESLKNAPLESGLSNEAKVNQQALKNTHINAISEILKRKNGGDIQGMISVYDAICPYEVSLLKPEITKAVKSLDKSINLETVEFFDKARDMELGSAPTDVLSILASIGMIGIGLTKADNKNDRVSVVLTSGIPIVGSIATSLICTAKLISGGKSMLTGIVSGILLNRLGTFTDNLRSKSIAKKSDNQAA